jgi:hypothetical protein
MPAPPGPPIYPTPPQGGMTHLPLSGAHAKQPDPSASATDPSKLAEGKNTVYVGKIAPTVEDEFIRRLLEVTLNHSSSPRSTLSWLTLTH